MNRGWLSLKLPLAILMMLGVIGAASSYAHAGAKCPDRYFKRKRLVGVGETQKEAEKAYKDGVPGKGRVLQVRLR